MPFHFKQVPIIRKRAFAMIKIFMVMSVISSLAACGELSNRQMCSRNSPADLQYIFSIELTDAVLRMSRAVAAAQEDRGFMAVPGYPLCWGLRTIAANAAGDEPTRNALARAGLTPTRYAATLINLEGYRHPREIGWPERQRWSASMLANERTVARFDRVLADETRNEQPEAKPPNE